MSKITQDQLWRLHELVQKKCRGMTHYHINTLSGSVSLSGNGAGVYDTTSIDSAIDYLDPPKPPTYDELYEIVSYITLELDDSRVWRALPVELRRKINGAVERHERAKAARPDEGSMFNLRGEE